MDGLDLPVKVVMRKSIPIPETEFVFTIGGTATIDIPPMTAVKVLPRDPRRATVYIFCDTLDARIGPTQAEAMDVRSSFVFSADRGMIVMDFTSELWVYNPTVGDTETVCILTEQWTL